MGGTDTDGRYFTSPQSDQVNMVRDLISHGDWNQDIMGSILNERDRKCIMSIHISEREPNDVVTLGSFIK